jgi:hypothetical protein
MGNERVAKFGFINDKGEIIVSSRPVLGIRKGDFAAILTSFIESPNGRPLSVEVVIGEGPSLKRVQLPIPLVSEDLMKAQLLEPQVFCSGELGTQFFIFRNQLFVVLPGHKTNGVDEEAILLMKKHVYVEDSKLARLRKDITVLEQAMNEEPGARRETIPEEVRFLVFHRDDGKCVRCGSEKNLHFDHIIPVAKGGGSTAQNIQILCQPCNLKKSDNIAF